MTSSTNPPTLAALLQQQAAVAAQTDREFAPFLRSLEHGVDALLRTPWLVDCDRAKERVSSHQVWAHNAYVNAAHSFAAIHQDLRGGFYLEAAVLLRHLTEVLVQIAYFAQRPQAARHHFVSPEMRDGKVLPPGTKQLPKRTSIQFRQMFDAVAPGYYEYEYRLASEFSHGGVGAIVFRMDEADLAKMGCFYSPRNTVYIAFQTAMLLRGFLSWFPDCFPDWDAEQGEVWFAPARSAIDKQLGECWDQAPGARDPMRLAGPLVRWNPPADVPL